MSPILRLQGCLLIALVCGPFAVAAYTDAMPMEDLRGEWGGEHIRLIVKETSSSAEFDCAFGEIDEPINPDKDGNFEVRGVYMFERGGPGRPVEPPPTRHPALYRGWTDGKEMRLTVSLLEGREMGTFSLALGRRAYLNKCS